MTGSASFFCTSGTLGACSRSAILECLVAMQQNGRSSLRLRMRSKIHILHVSYSKGGSLLFLFFHYF